MNFRTLLEAVAPRTAIDDNDLTKILGFYSIAPAALGHERLPEAMRRGLTRDEVPGYRLVRIATHTDVQGQGLGGQLLATAARRCIFAAVEVGAVILIIDAKNDRLARWYESYGAIPLQDAARSLVLSLATVAQELKAAGKL